MSEMSGGESGEFQRMLEVPEVERGGAFEFPMKLPSAYRAIGFVVVGGAFVLAGSAWFVGSKLIEPQNHTVAVPAGFSAEKVIIPGIGHEVSGWWVDIGKDSPVILLVHGLGADRSSMVSRAELLKQHGFSTLLIDLQGEGETKGDAITLGFRESRDVIAALDWIRGKAPGQKIGVIGTSLGGASVLLAPQPIGFDAVVLEAVYPRIGRAVENRIRMRLGFLAPVLTPLLLAQLEPRLDISVSDLEPIRWVGKLGAPVLIVAGSLDLHTTLEESRELFDAAAKPKSLWIVEGAIHEDLLAFDRQGYEEHVVGFLTAALEMGVHSTGATRAQDQLSELAPKDRATVSQWLQSHPEYRLAVDEDCACADDIGRVRAGAGDGWPPNPSYHAFYVTGDFANDGAVDVAAGVIKFANPKELQILILHGENARGEHRQDFLSESFPLKGNALFFGAPRPKPWVLLVGGFESEGAMFEPTSTGYHLNDSELE
jgi:uncharacterized protein